MPDYEYDIFLSYRRSDDEWVRWTAEIFLQSLRTLLNPGSPKIRIFADLGIEKGSSWPAYLAQAHARSKLLIPILSRDYFQSEWCRLELALMHERERLLGYRKPPLATHRLILPFVIDDGDCFAAEVQEMQAEPIHEFANSLMIPRSPRHFEFAERIRHWMPAVNQAMACVPPYDPAWEEFVHAHFATRFLIQLAAQTTLPGLSLAPLPKTP